MNQQNIKQATGKLLHNIMQTKSKAQAGRSVGKNHKTNWLIVYAINTSRATQSTRQIKCIDNVTNNVEAKKELRTMGGIIHVEFDRENQCKVSGDEQIFLHRSAATSVIVIY